jgi:tetratricopeptide (TPR) repeat protein/tRNA A-37 threonylcarbamoyl transferase component Bud32
MIGRTFSHYRILELLGEGGMGSVYVAEDTHLGRQVAIKFPAVTRDEHHYRARFLREARAVSMLNHQNIATIYDYGETDDGQPFIVMELVKGPTLGSLLEGNGLTLQRAVEIVGAVGGALAEAHSKGIVHRDIKPTNVVLNERGVPKVLDFGLAKQTGEEQFKAADPDARTLLATKTRSGAVVGTPLYLSPEQATGAPVDARSDIFALGALFYECITGKPAFEGESVIEIVAQVIHIDPPPPSSLNPNIQPELDRITLKALRKKPAERYQSVAEFIEDLSTLKGQMQGLHSTATQRIQRAPGTFGRSALTTFSEKLWQPRLSLFALFAVVGLIILAFMFVPRMWRPTPHQLAPAAKRPYEDGVNALRDGTYFKASNALKRAILIDDKYALAHARLAEAWMELDYTERSKEEIIEANSLMPDSSLVSPLELLYIRAVTNIAKRDFAGAIKSYTEILNLIPEGEKAYALVDLGRAYEKNEEIDKAIENYIEATNRDPQYATAFLRVGVLYGRKQDIMGALGALKRAESIYRDQSNFEGLTEVFFQRAVLFNGVGRLAEAREQFESALNITRTTNNRYQHVQALLGLTRVAYGGGQTDRAKQHATEAIALARADGLENLITQGLLDLGYSFFVARDYGQTEQHFKEALNSAERNKSQFNRAKAILYLGSLYIQQEKPDEGLPLIEEALGFFQSKGYRKEVATAMLKKGRAKLFKGEYDEGLKIFDDQLRLAKEVDNPGERARSQIEIGTALARQELYPQAIRHLTEGFEVSQWLNNDSNAGYSLLNRADMMVRLGRYEDAKQSLKQLQETIERLEKSNNYKQLWRIWIPLLEAQIALSDQRFGDAKAKSHEALAQASAPQFKPSVAEIKATLALTEARAGAQGVGKGLCEEAVAIAQEGNDPRLLSTVRLVFAEILLESGDAAGALTAAQQAQEVFARGRRQESEWRAWLIAGLASQRLGNAEGMRTQLDKAKSLLLNLEEKWGSEGFTSYLAKRDIQFYRKKLDEAYASKP